MKSQTLTIKSFKVSNYTKSSFYSKRIISISCAVLVSCFFVIFAKSIWAQIESFNKDSSNDSVSGVTNLMSSVLNHDVQSVLFYTKSGSSFVNKRNMGGATALHLACRENDIEIVKILIDAGAEINVSDKEGWTPLMRASLVGSPDIVDLLISKGAEIESLNNYGEVAILHSVISGCTKCLDLMMRKISMIKVIESESLRNQIIESYELARVKENREMQEIMANFNNQVLKIVPLTSKKTDESDSISQDLAQNNSLSNQDKNLSPDLNDDKSFFNLKSSKNSLNDDGTTNLGLSSDSSDKKIYPLTSKKSEYPQKHEIQKLYKLIMGDPAMNKKSRKPIIPKFKKHTSYQIEMRSSIMSDLLKNNEQIQAKKTKSDDYDYKSSLTEEQQEEIRLFLDGKKDAKEVNFSNDNPVVKLNESDDLSERVYNFSREKTAGKSSTKKVIKHIKRKKAKKLLSGSSDKIPGVSVDKSKTQDLNVNSSLNADQKNPISENSSSKILSPDPKVKEISNQNPGQIENSAQSNSVKLPEVNKVAPVNKSTDSIELLNAVRPTDSQ